MTKFLDCDEIVERFEDADIYTTDNPFEAIFLLPDGRLIDGDYECGVRGLDHRCVDNLFTDITRYSENFWIEMFYRTSIILLEPETQTAYYYEPISNEQQAVLDELGYSVKYYD